MWGIVELARAIVKPKEAIKSHRAADPKRDGIVLLSTNDKVYPANSTT